MFDDWSLNKFHETETECPFQLKVFNIVKCLESFSSDLVSIFIVFFFLFFSNFSSQLLALEEQKKTFSHVQKKVFGLFFSLTKQGGRIFKNTLRAFYIFCFRVSLSFFQSCFPSFVGASEELLKNKLRL